jgi:hypothetical protein
MKSNPMRAIVALFLCTVSADAIILFGLDNSGNTTNPGSGAPWGSVGRLSNASGTTVGGSGVYLGNGYVLTAAHVGPFASITFDGSTFYTHDGATPVPVAPNVDMKILRLTETPTVAAVNVYTGTSELNQSATIVGWGVGRDPMVTINTNDVVWGGNSTSEKRWGLNVPKATANISFGGGSYQALVTVLGGNSNPNQGLGASEAAVTLLDSGGGMFQQFGGVWFLTGLTVGVENGTFGESSFGQDRTTSTRGDFNYFARVSNFSSQINTMIPEPSALLFASSALLLLLRRRR